MTLHYELHAACACQSREPDSRRSRVKVWLRETSSVRCIAVVVNSLTCIVSDKQLTSGQAGEQLESGNTGTETGTETPKTEVKILDWTSYT